MKQSIKTQYFEIKNSWSPSINISEYLVKEVLSHPDFWFLVEDLEKQPETSRFYLSIDNKNSKLVAKESPDFC